MASNVLLIYRPSRPPIRNQKDAFIVRKNAALEVQRVEEIPIPPRAMRPGAADPQVNIPQPSINQKNWIILEQLMQKSTQSESIEANLGFFPSLHSFTQRGTPTTAYNWVAPNYRELAEKRKPPTLARRGWTFSNNSWSPI